MEKAHAPPDQDHHHLHSSMPILKQQQEEEEEDHHQEQEQEQEQLKNMTTEEQEQEQEQDLNLENQPKKEQEDDMSSLHVPELPPRVNPSPSSDKTQARKEEEAEGGRRKEEEEEEEATNTTSVTSSSTWRSGRERLQRHRKEVAGHVWIPETWGQEDLLKDWIDCSQFDACLVPTGVVSARAALVHQAATPNSNSSPLRIDNSPSTRPAGPPS